MRWRYAAGVGGWDGTGRVGFVHTVLVDMRERLRASQRPNRVFEVALDAARAAGLLGRRRVLDSTPLYDAVATMDTITLIRSAIRGLLAAADADLAGLLRAAIGSAGVKIVASHCCASMPTSMVPYGPGITRQTPPAARARNDGREDARTAPTRRDAETSGG